MLKTNATTNYNPKINDHPILFLYQSYLPQHINENNKEVLLFQNMLKLILYKLPIEIQRNNNIDVP
jgi:hypothetical protein